MTDLIERARSWIDTDPDPSTRQELRVVLDEGDVAELSSRMDTVLEFGTAGIRGTVGAGPGRMNRAVIIRTTDGLASHLLATADGEVGTVIVGFDARPDSRVFAEDTAGVLAAHGIPVLYFSEPTPTPLVAFAAKHLSASAAVVVTASHNPPADNGYKVYGPDASQIVSPMDIDIQQAIGRAPGASEVDRIAEAFSSGSNMIDRVPRDLVDRYWDEVSATRSRRSGSTLRVVYTPIHGVGKKTLFEIMTRAGHQGLVAVPEQAEPDGTFPTVSFPNPEEPGALDLALRLAAHEDADLVIANDPDADRLAAVVPDRGHWRPMSGNEVGSLLGDYILANDPSPDTAIVASSIVSSPMLADIAASYGASHESTLTGFKWIVRAGLAREIDTGGRFVFGYEEALGYTVGSAVRDKDGMSAALLFLDLVADLDDAGLGLMDRLHDLWRRHGLWVSAQTSITRAGPDGIEACRLAVERLGDDPPTEIDGMPVTGVVDYRTGSEDRPAWLGEQALIQLDVGSSGRVLVRPSGTEPKLKIYTDLREECGDLPDAQHHALVERAGDLGRVLGGQLGL
ncbi:MAG TPA: phospho-sugar mutase [Acidimicrobiia bacterium]|nr:phospho-sugar mutase [Acidimicrobiia bacterium]